MKGLIAQFSASIFLAVMSLSAAFAIVWPSYALPILSSDRSPLGFNPGAAAINLIGSIPMLGSLMATMCASTVSDRLGRKKTHLLAALVTLVSWSLILTARSTAQLLIARFIGGFVSGLTLVNIIIYIAEISVASIRGSSIACAVLMYNVGILMSYVEGWMCGYDVICYLNVSGMAAYVVVLCWLKDTPVWYLKYGREKEALESLKFYRGESRATDAVLEELSNLKGQFQQYQLKEIDVEKEELQLKNEKSSLNEEKPSGTKYQSTNPYVLLFTSPHNRHAFLPLMCMFVLAVCMGMIAVLAFAGQFFSKAAPALSPNLCSVVLALVLVASSVLTVCLTDLFGRRPLLLCTTAAASACLSVLAAVLRWSAGPAWLPALLVLLFCVFYHLGPVNVPFLILTESFGPEVSSSASSLSLSAMFMANFVVLYAYGPAVNRLGLDGTFCLFAAMGLLMTVLCHLLVRETKGKSLGEVQKEYAKGYFN